MWAAYVGFCPSCAKTSSEYEGDGAEIGKEALGAVRQPAEVRRRSEREVRLRERTMLAEKER